MNRPDDNVAAFDRALKEARNQKVELKLFVAGMGPRSTQAVAHVKELCKMLGDRCNVQIVDIYEHPGAAAASQVVAVPALVRNSPRPVRKLIGTIGNALDAARMLGLLTPGREGT